MSTLAYNEILPKKVIEFNNEPCVVLSAHVFRKQQRKPVNNTKLRGLQTGRVIEQTFHQSDTVKEADLESITITFIYRKPNECWFHRTGTPSDRFSLSDAVIGEQIRFLQPMHEYEALVYQDEVIGIKFPIKIDAKVTEAMPAVKGNTSSGAQKEVTIETGTTVMVPMFIHEGDVIRINTETGEYDERVTKA
jgi:elongation factor P